MEIIKYKKQFRKKKLINIRKKNLGLIFIGYYGIKANSHGILTPKQIETIRRILVRISKRTSKIFIRVIFKHPLTMKSLQSRMGKGVGNIKQWICYIRKGLIFLEIIGITKILALKAFKLIQFKLPIKIKFIEREVWNYGLNSSNR